MKFTDYFQNKVLIKRPYLKLEWIEYVMNNPIKIEYQIEDNRIRIWGYIEEINKYLRVITLEDGETIHNAFPDRDFVE
jgi:hypothetical protein